MITLQFRLPFPQQLLTSKQKHNYETPLVVFTTFLSRTLYFLPSIRPSSHLILFKFALSPCQTPLPLPNQERDFSLQAFLSTSTRQPYGGCEPNSPFASLEYLFGLNRSLHLFEPKPIPFRFQTRILASDVSRSFISLLNSFDVCVTLLFTHCLSSIVLLYTCTTL